MKIKYQHFSLIELLVIVAVIAILISLLQPSLQKIMVMSNRTLCSQHLKESIKVSHIIAEDQSMSLPKGQRSNGSNDHTIWISRKTFQQYLQYGLLEKHIMCPNIKGEVYGLEEGQVLKFNKWVLIWSHYLGNRPSLKARTKPGNKNSPAWNYTIPIRSDEDGSQVLFADGNAYGYAGGGWTLAPHEVSQDRVWEGYPVTPMSLGAEGGNVGYLDGSVTWKDMADMNEYNVASPQYKGYW